MNPRFKWMAACEAAFIEAKREIANIPVQLDAIGSMNHVPNTDHTAMYKHINV
jgi:hypothetical protein